MTSQKLPLVIFLEVGASLLAGGEENFQRMFDEFEQAMQQQIGRIHADCDADELYKVQELRISFPSASAETPFGSPMRQVSSQMQDDGRNFVLDAKLLKAVVAAHDPDYDVHNPPSMFTKVVPPPETGFWTSVNPDEIEDAAIREKYRADVAENNRRVRKHHREKELESLRRHLINSLQGNIGHLKQMNPSKLPYIITMLDEAIEDKEVRRAIFANAMLSKVDLGKCDKPPTPSIEAARKFLPCLLPDTHQKIIDEIKAWYPEEERKLFDTPLLIRRPGSWSIEDVRSHATGMHPQARKQLLDQVKEKSDYTEEELKIIDALYDALYEAE